MNRHRRGAARTSLRLYPHQTAGMAFLQGAGRAVLADAPGLGKTRQAILALAGVAPESMLLILCPASLVLHWRDEIQACDPAAAIELLGTPDGACAGRPRWVVAPYDLLPRQLGPLRRIPWAGAILDEAQRLTETPALGRHVAAALRLATALRPLYLLTAAPEAARRLPAALGLPALPVLRRTRAEAPGLPPRQRLWRPVPLDDPALTRAEHRFLTWLEEAAPTRTDRRDVLAELQRVRRALHRAKRPLVAERIRDVLAGGRKLLLLATFPEGVAWQAERFGLACVTLGPEDDLAARARAAQAFREDDRVRLALCHPLAAGFARPPGTHLIVQDLAWVPAELARAEAAGGEAPAAVEYLVGAGTIEAPAARLLAAELARHDAGEAPADSILPRWVKRLRALAPELLPLRGSRRHDPAARLAAIAALSPAGALQPGSRSFRASGAPGLVHRVTWDAEGRLDCSCASFDLRGTCRHVRTVHRSGFDSGGT